MKKSASLGVTLSFLLATCASLSLIPTLSAQTFYLNNSLNSGPTLPPYNFGLQSDIPLAGKFVSGGTVSYGVYRPSNQTFYLSGFLGAIYAETEIQFGIPGDIPLVGDWNGDGITDIGVYRPSDLTFYLRYSATRTDTIVFGTIGDLPVVGDWNGDGIWSPGVYRPSNSTYYLTNTATTSIAPPVWQTTTYGGGSYGGGNLPIVGDWNGAGETKIGMVASGGQWLLTNQYGPSYINGYPNIPPFFFGAAGDQFVAGDWDGNGTVTPGAYRSPIQFSPILVNKLLTCGNKCSAQSSIPFPFPFFGKNYSTLYVNSDGSITFGSPDTNYQPTVAAFNSQPRIAPFFNNLVTGPNSVDPTAAVYTSDSPSENPNELIFTYYREQLSGTYPGPDTVQVQLYSDGRIVMAYRGITSRTSGTIAGITPGTAPLRSVDFRGPSCCGDLPAGTGIYQMFADNYFHLDYSFINFTPDGSGGYYVRTY